MDHVKEASDLLKQAEEGARLLTRLGSSAEHRIEAARLRVTLAGYHIQLAAIEKGLQPPSLVLHPQDGA